MTDVGLRSLLQAQRGSCRVLSFRSRECCRAVTRAGLTERTYIQLGQTQDPRTQEHKYPRTSKETLFRKPTHPTYIFRIWSLPPSDRAPILSFILSNSLRYFSLLSHSGIPLGNTRLAGYPVAGQTIMIPLLRRNTGSQQLPEKTINPSIPADENYIMTWPSF